MKKNYIIITAILLISSLYGCSESFHSDPSNDVAASHQPILQGHNSTLPTPTGVVNIFVQDYPKFQNQIVCTGTLIAPKTVLTAAHCVAELSEQYLLFNEDASDPKCKWQGGNISIGASDIVNYLRVGSGPTLKSSLPTAIEVDQVIYHSGYSTLSEAQKCTDTNYEGYSVTRNDIAILKLKSDFDPDDAVPIPILPPWFSITQEQVKSGLTTLVTGFGYDEFGDRGILLETQLPIEMYCSSADGDSLCAYGKTVHVKGCHPDSMLCQQYGKLDYYEDRLAIPAGSFFYLQSTGGPCQGDSGGPALLNIGNKYYLAGITSYGDNACSAYGISTAVQDYYDWIVKNAPAAKDEIIEVCGNGLDDDNNGKADGDDPYCSGKSYCGDGKLDTQTEECDGELFKDELVYCAAWSREYRDGKVSCRPDCFVDYSACVKRDKPQSCGNHVLDEDEDCDAELIKDPYGGTLQSNLCSDFSAFFNDGTIKCNDNCTYNTAGCRYHNPDDPYCGDGVIQKGEMCDGTSFLGGLSENCTDWDSKYIDGIVLCTECKPDLSQCIKEDVCGDQKLSYTELCDGDLFLADETSCAEWGTLMGAGTVKCSANCTIDLSPCTPKPEYAELCGNHQLDADLFGTADDHYGEECDGDLFKKGTNCSDWDARFSSGTVTCNDNCTVNLEKCMLAEHARYLDESARSTMYQLNGNAKPTLKAPEKESDSVAIQTGGNLKEILPDFIDTSTEPGENPGDHDNPTVSDPIDNPQDPVEPVPDDDPISAPSDDHSSCSALPLKGSQSPAGTALILFAISAILYKRREKNL